MSLISLCSAVIPEISSSAGFVLLYRVPSQILNLSLAVIETTTANCLPGSGEDNSLSRLRKPQEIVIKHLLRVMLTQYAGKSTAVYVNNYTVLL